MEIVELVVGPGPGHIGIVDFEPDVGRNPAGLDWADVGADDLGVRELIAKITIPRVRACFPQLSRVSSSEGDLHCPDTGSRAYIEDILEKP